MRSSGWFPKIATVALALLLASAAPAAARDMFGVRTGFYTDVDEPFIGIEGLFGLGHHVYLNPNFEYVFTEDPHYMTFNADFHYDFPTRSRAYVWAGAGLGVLYTNPEVGDSNTRRRAQPAVRRGPQGPRGPLRPGKGDRVGRHRVRAGGRPALLNRRSFSWKRDEDHD
jgi:hypothetical protein